MQTKNVYLIAYTSDKCYYHYVTLSKFSFEMQDVVSPHWRYKNGVTLHEMSCARLLFNDVIPLECKKKTNKCCNINKRPMINVQTYIRLLDKLTTSLWIAIVTIVILVHTTDLIWYKVLCQHTMQWGFICLNLHHVISSPL